MHKGLVHLEDGIANARLELQHVAGGLTYRLVFDPRGDLGTKSFDVEADDVVELAAEARVCRESGQVTLLIVHDL